MAPKYTFVVPVRDGARTLPQTLASIHAQSLQDFELVVVDNNSSDDTRRIAEADPRARYVFCEEIGRSYARNAGARAANSEFIAFVDCDVQLFPDWLACVEEYLARTPVDLLATAVIPSPQGRNNAVDRYRYFFAQFKSHGTFVSLRKYREVAPIVNSSACVVKHKSFQVAKGYDERLSHAEDFELSLRMFCQGFLIGGVSAARSTVLFEGSWRLWRYLKRSFIHGYHGLTKSSSLNYDFLVQLREASSQRDVGLFFLIVLKELIFSAALVVARFSPGIQKRNQLVRSRWIISPRMKMLRFSFQSGGKLYHLSSKYHVLLLDDLTFVVDHDFKKTTKLGSGVAGAVRDLWCGRPLGKTQQATLEECEFFGRLALP